MAKLTAQALLDEARRLEREGKYALASAKYAQLALWRRKKGKLDDVKSLLERALRLTPDSPRLYLQLAICEADRGEEEAARRQMEQFTQKAKARLDRLAYYTDYLEEELKDYPELRRVFYEPPTAVAPPPPAAPAEPPEQGVVVSLPPDRERTLSDLIREVESELGIEHEKLPDNVAPFLRKYKMGAGTLLAGDSKSRIDMALAFHEMELTEHACEELRAIPPSDMRYAEARCLLGDILLRSGDTLGALEVFQELLRLEGLDEASARESRYQLIQIYSRLEDWEQALAQARTLERLWPDYRDTRVLRAYAETMAGRGKKAG